MPEMPGRRSVLSDDVCVRALKARDARFDGVFFVGITSTSIYCRPVCPARVSRPDNRRFFDTAAAAERAGFRPCRRCRPELAPGRALVDAVSRLAWAATRRIAAGALNGRTVGELAAELCVGERHLRRALEREIGVTPVELAQTHRLLLAKRLLTDTALPIARVAYSAGFQSLRRFNVTFRERYGMSPGVLRRKPARQEARRGRRSRTQPEPSRDGRIRLTLAYRIPYAWDAMIAFLESDAVRGIERMDAGRFMRTVRIDGHAGIVVIDLRESGAGGAHDGSGGSASLPVDVSPSLLPVLMPLLARLRQLFDLDAEPAVVDACLERAGLGALVRRRPGMRIPGAFDGFEAALRVLLRGRSHDPSCGELAVRVTAALGERIDTGEPGLTHLSPGADAVADAGTGGLVSLGVPPDAARPIEALARAVADGSIRLDAGSDVDATCAALAAIPGLGNDLAIGIAARVLGWPDTFDPSDPVLQRVAGGDQDALRVRAEQWRPWRAYAAMQLRAQAADPAEALRAE
jgi:AraC family transcriptional regulator, regulatory protein of adaptative response / DNA-3-methyladenine glycosylase II